MLDIAGNLLHLEGTLGLMPLYTPGMIWASGALHSYSFVFIADAIFYLLETLENNILSTLLTLCFKYKKIFSYFS